jgi:hypothetical protein
MPEPDDITLLREYAETGSETAFATLVGRHLNLVYSTALRSTGAPHSDEKSRTPWPGHRSFRLAVSYGQADRRELFADGNSPAKTRAGGAHAIAIE